MGGYTSKPVLDLAVYKGLPYPYVLLKLHEQGIRAFLVAMKKGDEYHPSAKHTIKKSVVVLYDAETASVIRCIYN